VSYIAGTDGTFAITVVLSNTSLRLACFPTDISVLTTVAIRGFIEVRCSSFRLSVSWSLSCTS